MSVAISPKYDGTTTHDWTWGNGDTGSGSNRFLTAGTPAGGWLWCVQLMRLQAGTYTITEAAVQIEQWAAGNEEDDARVYLVAYNYSAPNYTNIITPIEVTSDIPNAAVNTEQQLSSTFAGVSAANRTFTVSAGDDIRIGWAMYRGPDVAATTSPRILSHVTAGENGGMFQLTRNLTSSADTAIEPLDTTDSPTGRRGIIRKLVLKTSARLITKETGAPFSGTTITREIPAGDSSTPFWVIMGACKVTDGFTLSFDFEDVQNEVATSRIVATMDFSAAGQMTLGANSEALNAVTTEAGDSFNLYFYFDPATKSIDWFWSNRDTGQGGEGSTDLAIISHVSKRLAAHGGTLPTIAEMPTQVTISASGGTASVGGLSVSREPVVVLGDSQSRDDSGRIGVALPIAFTNDRAVIAAWVAGNQISATTSTTSGEKRYCHTTPGLGDICDMRGVIIAIPTFMVNDILNSRTPAQINTATANIITDALSNGVEVILLGGVPLADGHPSAGTGNPLIISTNTLLEATATTKQIAWFNPHNAVLARQADYIDSGDDLHLTANGATFVSEQLASSVYESGAWGGCMGRGRGRTRGRQRARAI